MQVDSLNTAKNNFNFGSTFEDFFNLDYNANPSSSSQQQQQQQRQRSRSSSPEDSFSHLPPTPQQPMINDPTSSSSSNTYATYGYNFTNNSSNNLSSPLSFPIPMDPDSLFNFLPEDDQFMLKTGLGSHDPLSSTTSSSSVESSPYDFFGALNDFHVNSNTNSRRAAGSNSLYTGDVAMTAGAGSGAYVPFAIDPQLVGTPASSTTSPSTTRHNGFNNNTNGNSAPSEADDEESNSTSPDQINALPSPQTSFNADDDEAEMGDTLMPLAPVKVGGKGKAARKGTVMSGGVVKKTSAVVNTGAKKKENKDKSRNGDLDGDDDDKDDIDWRPSPEEYAKMSSKEKRQLRNKISARNFRVRRKEYIHTLEGDIADRDRLIDAIRTELGSTRSENYALRQEIAILKKAVLEGRASPMLPPPAPLSPISPMLSPTSLTFGNVSGSSTTQNNNKSSEPLLTPNMSKDLPSSPRMAGARGFWAGTAAGNGSFGAGGYTPVHTTLVPDFQLPQGVIASSVNMMSAVLAGKNGVNPAPTTRVLQENMNPSLNLPTTTTSMVGKYDKHNTPPQSPPNTATTRPFANANLKANTTPSNGLYNVGLGFAGNTNNNSINDVLNGSNLNATGVNANGNSINALGGFGNLSGGALSASSMSNSGFDAFVDMNPFTMKTLDAYRMQLWGRMAALQHQRNNNAVSSSSSSTTVNSSNINGETSLTGLASAMRPHYFTPAVSGGANMISGMALGNASAKLFSFNAAFRAQSYGHGLPTPPSSPHLGSSISNSNTNSVSSDEVQTRMENSIRNVNNSNINNNNAMLAATAAATAIASQTILSKLGHAFWDAFSGSGSSVSSSSSLGGRISNNNNALPNWDADKVRRVLEGKAVLRVVDVDSNSPPSSPKMGINTVTTTAAAAVAGVSAVNADGADKLEESMRGLNIGSGGEKTGLVDEVKDCFAKRCERMKMRAAGRCGRGCSSGGFN